MSAETIHGGGVTLQRVIGDELESFRWIAKTIHLPDQPLPTYRNETDSFLYPWWQHQNWLSKLIGDSRAYRLANHRLIRKAFARHVANDLSKSMPALDQDQVLVCPQADITLLVMEQLQRQQPIDYVTWMMDDHLVKWCDGEWAYPPGFQERMGTHLRDARQVFVISQTMQEFYHDRFGVDSTILHAPAVCHDIPMQHKHLTCVRLVYFGSLGPWQNDAIELLKTSLEARAATLDVYSMNPNAIPSALVGLAQIREPVPPSEVQTTIANYNAVVLPISFSDEKRNMSYFNIATKFSECLGSGIPTLIIGPTDAAMVRSATASNAAMVVNLPDSTLVEQAVDQLCDPNERQQLVKAAKKLVNREMTPDVMQSRWKSAWNS
ncbi:MAG: hypothetical protein ABJZ55_00415 [Fuerstiella sp.]